nr:hypothetical protein KPHV_86090 [Kitasatospora purpeofusca]
MSDPIKQSGPDGRRHRRPAAGLESADGRRSRLTRLALAPAATMTVLGATAGALPLVTSSPVLQGAAPAVVVLGALGVLTSARRRALATAAELHRALSVQDSVTAQWVDHFARHLDAARADLLAVHGQILRDPGAQPAVPGWDAGAGGTVFGPLEDAIRLLVQDAQAGIVQAGADRMGKVFLNLARRLQSLVIREIDELDALERNVEDPELLDGLLRLDHLATRTLRQVESLAVICGAVPRRTREPVGVSTLLRQVLGEIEQYSRVRIVPPVSGTIHGRAVADIVHLLAELLENATAFSRPETVVNVYVSMAAAGLVVDIDDRGLGMTPDRMASVERVLADPDSAHLSEQLADGRIGMIVVSRLAGRHGVRVVLRPNVLGGIRASVLLPHALLDAAEPDPFAGTIPAARHRYPGEPAFTAGPPAAPGRPGVLPGGGAAVARPAAHAGTHRPAQAQPAVGHPGGRPALPRREPQGSYLVEQLRQDRLPDAGPSSGPDTGLAASFLRSATAPPATVSLDPVTAPHHQELP